MVLGLAVVKRIVEAYNGRSRLRVKKGAGRLCGDAPTTINDGVERG
ncbi:MAG: hypothetical protein ACXVIG_04460 [Halobacteriota archaeon]